MEGNEQLFLQALGIGKEQHGELPDYLVKGDPPDKVRLGFRNKIEPPITLDDYTIITVTHQDFVRIVQMYLSIGRFG